MNRFENVTGGGFAVKDTNPLVWIMAWLLTVVLAGCGGGSSVLGVSGASGLGAASGNATSVSFKVTPSGVAPSSLVAIPVTGTQQYTAIETFSDGSTIDRTAVSTWTGVNAPAGGAAVAILSTNGAGGGLATGAVIGTSAITATYTVGSVVQSATATLTVNAATSTSFVVKPATTVSIPVSGTQQYSVIETFSDGSTFDRTAASAWTSVNVPAGGAAVATLSVNGLATGLVAGTSTITATLGAQSASATLTVNAAISRSFVVKPATAVSIPVSGTQQYSVIEAFSDGSTFDRTAASTWTSVNVPAGGAAVATLSANGLATGLVAGTSTITATLGAQSASATLTVNAAISRSFVVKPATAVSIPVSGTQQYAAIETFSDGSTFDRTAASAWTSVNVPVGGTAVATLSTNGVAGGLATGAATGTATITATLGAQAASATLIVNSKTLLSLSVGPQTASIPVNGTQQYTAIATWSDQTSSDVTTSSTWSFVSGAAFASISNAGPTIGLATGTSAGTSTITASYTIGGITRNANLLPATLTVIPKTLLSLSVGPQTASISVNGTQQYTATATWSDQTSSDVTTAVTTSWTAIDATGGPGVVTLSANGVGGGLATGAVIGTSTITASYTIGGITKNANLLPATLTVTAGAGTVPLAINLGSAATYGIASRAGLTSTGVAVVNGDVALSPLATCTDSTGNAGASETCLTKIHTSPTGLTVNGSIYFAGDPFDAGATALSATNALTTAWTQGMNKIDTFAVGFLGGQLAGKTMVAGVYDEANLGLSAGGTATFDGQGDPNAIFIVKIGTIGGTGDFTDSGTLLLPTQIMLINGAQARNIWFVVGRDITIGSGTIWNGNILAGRTTTVNNGSSVMGRVLAGANGAGAFTITGAASPSLTTITVPPN